MAVAIAALSLILLMIAAYRGMSVIIMAPVLAMLAVLLTDPAAVPAAFSGLFMEKVASFLKLYFPVFLLGALFGKLVEISGFSRAIVTAVIGIVGAGRAIPAIMAVTATKLKSLAAGKMGCTTSQVGDLVVEALNQ